MSGHSDKKLSQSRLMSNVKISNAPNLESGVEKCFSFSEA